MKLTFVFVIASFFQVSASGVAQSVSFTGKKVPLEKVFLSVKKQTGFVFFCNEELLNDTKPVSIKAENMPLNDFLEKLFNDQPVGYILQSRSISLYKKTDIPEPNKTFPVFNFPPGSVTGRVYDETGTPLPNINVIIKGTTKGTVTDANGAFSISTDAGTMLVFSGIGLDKKEIKIVSSNFGSDLNITLQKSFINLDETVVIAYGTTTQRNSVGNVTTVQSKDIEKQPVNNVLSALEGRSPGLFIAQSTGLPGTGISVQIQGKNSIGNGNLPFYVVDGVPYAQDLLFNMGGIYGVSSTTGGAGNPLNYLNPSDIESITVLKDADATAIYGSRAANGAILITTKKGKAGQTKIDFNLQQGNGRVASKMKLLSLKQYLEMRHEAIKNDGLTTGATDYDINGVWDTTRYTDLQKALIGRTAHYTDLNGTVSGGNTNTQYLVGLTYHRETSVFPGDFSDNKGAMHFSINSSSNNQRFRMQLAGNYLMDINRLPNTDLTNDAILYSPDVPPMLNKDGSINWALDENGNSTWRILLRNPMAETLLTYKNKTSSLTSNLHLSYEIIKGLKLESSFGYNNLQTNEISKLPLTYFAPANRPFVDRQSSFSNNNINSWIVEPQLTYKREVYKGDLEFFIGASIQQRNSNGLIVNATGFSSDAILENIQAATNVSIGSYILSTYKYNALFGRLNYNWKKKYIFNFTARRDGSSRFGSANQFQNFGSLGAAWIFTEEDFIKNNFNVLSFGKIKASYGTTGSDQIGDYRVLSLYNPAFASVPYQNVSGLKPNGLNNPYLQWEESRKMNIGLDLGLLRDRILFSANYFRNRSSNQLLSVLLASMAGFTTISQNLPALVQNTGWEFSLKTVNIKMRDFEWSSNFNATIPKNKLIEYPGLERSSDRIKLSIGAPITQVAVYHFLGVDPATGVYLIADSHGNPTTSPGTADQNRHIDIAPTLYGGLDNNFTFRNLTLDVFLQFVKQNGPGYSFGRFPGAAINQPVSVLKRWQKPGDVAPVQRYNSSFSISYPFQLANSISDASYSDASYIRVKNVSLSWQISNDWCNRVHLKNASIYLHAQNLFTITHYSGLDPETRSISSLPPLKVITVGLKIGL